MSMKKLLLWAVGAVALYLGFSFVKYHISEAFDYSDRPWAYSRDAATPLLVGKWEGDFTDPDGVKKAIQLEIFVPETDSERLGKAFKTSKRRKFSYSKTAFDGVVMVTSRLGKEEYDINGGVSKDDDHQFHFKFYQAENTKRVLPNFNLNEAISGKWKGNHLEFSAKFSFHKADGSSLWTSSDARFSKNVLVEMERQ
jgi:hypothetical protein